MPPLLFEAVPPVVHLLGAALVLSLAVSVYTNKSRKLPLPPGPRPLPFVGNLFNVPKERAFLGYSKWASDYGSDILFMQLPSQPAIILNTVEAACDLMYKRSSIYSDKPKTIMDELVGWDWAIPTMPYGHHWRQARRYFHQHFHAGAVHKYREMQTRGVRAYLLRMLEAEGGKASTLSVMHLVAAVIMDVTYGIRIKGMDDPFVTEIQDAIVSFNQMKVPGAFWVNIFPVLKYLPRWFPGETFHRYCELHKPRVAIVKEHPFSQTIQDMNDGVASPSVMQNLVRTIQERYPAGSPEYAEQENYVKDAGATAYGAAVETTYATICWFILAMAMYPSVQEKAQRELDRVVGSARLPVWEDGESLPYIQALIRESLRWIPNIPMGVPHRVLVEDEYKGYRIPQGSMIIPNVWSMCHNVEDYPHPDIFDPDRFLTADGQINPDVRDPETFVFGFGRRICAGRAFAKQSLFLTVSSVLSAFHVRPACDGNGDPLELRVSDVMPADGLFLHPERLDCIFVPRSEQAAKSVRQSYE